MNRANKKALVAYFYEGLSLKHAIEIIERGGYTTLDNDTIKAACDEIKACGGTDWTTVVEHVDPHTVELDAYFGR